MSNKAALLWALGFSALFIACVWKQVAVGCDALLACCAIGFWLMWLSKHSRDVDYSNLPAPQAQEQPGQNELYRDRTRGSTRMIPKNFK